MTDSKPTLTPEEVLAIDCVGLEYSFAEGLESALDGVDLQLKKGDRCLLVGANGAGKSTLLRILAGKRLTKTRSCKIKGQDVFMSSPGGVVYLGTEWASNPVVRSDIVVSHFLDSVGGYRHKARRDKLLSLLDVDLDWTCRHMHQISDGERRRVQLCMGLMGEWDVLLLDEVTVDLDVLVRSDLIDFLVSESETRGATIVYATHIFDGLHPFPTQVCHMLLGKTTAEPLPWPPAPDAEGAKDLFHLALGWLKADKVVRKEREQVTGRIRGPKPETTDAKTFFEKYDYQRR